MLKYNLFIDQYEGDVNGWKEESKVAKLLYRVQRNMEHMKLYYTFATNVMKCMQMKPIYAKSVIVKVCGLFPESELIN